MNFYASTEYLNVAGKAYFPGKSVTIEDVSLGDTTLRLLVVDGKRAITELPFIDYHEPLQDEDIATPRRRCIYAKSVVRNMVKASEWDEEGFEGCRPAPFIDWSKFPTEESYTAYLKSHRKGLYNELQRKRRRLADNFGALEFTMDDWRADVLDLAVQWKAEQLRDTGALNYLADIRNIRHFELLRENGLLTTSTLRADGRLLSVWIGFVHDGIWSGWVFTYDHDPALRKYSVGMQLLFSMVKESHQLGHRQFDFSIGGEPYKFFFATDVRVVGPIGRPPLNERLAAGTKSAKAYAKQVLSSHPRLLDGAVALSKAIRKERNQLSERFLRLGHTMRFDRNKS